MNTLLFDHNQSPMIGAYYFFKGDLPAAERDLKILAEAGINHLWLFIDEYFRKDNPSPQKDFYYFQIVKLARRLLFSRPGNQNHPDETS